MEQVKTLVEQRLTAAVEDILGIVENVIKCYEEKDSRSKSEIERQNRLLDILLKPKMALQRAGADSTLQSLPGLSLPSLLCVPDPCSAPVLGDSRLLDPPQLPVCQEEVPPEQQERSPSLGQEDPEPPQIKEEQEENWTSREGEELQWLEEADTKDAVFAITSVKSLHDQHQSQSPLNQTVENREGEPLPSTSTEQMETEADKEGCRKGERSYSCSVCGKVLTRLGSVQKHMKTHTGEKPYACNVCGKRFRQHHHVQYHMKTHTGEKPYRCNFCWKGFSRQDCVQMHMKTHTGEKPYSCSVCGKGFIQTSNLKKHMKNHSGAKPYCCSVCGKGFIISSELKKHMRFHTSTECGAGFIAEEPL